MIISKKGTSVVFDELWKQPLKNITEKQVRELC